VLARARHRRRPLQVKAPGAAGTAAGVLWPVLAVVRIKARAISSSRLWQAMAIMSSTSAKPVLCLDHDPTSPVLSVIGTPSTTKGAPAAESCGQSPPRKASTAKISRCDTVLTPAVKIGGSKSGRR
jgi:hypothetical protein